MASRGSDCRWSVFWGSMLRGASPFRRLSMSAGPIEQSVRSKLAAAFSPSYLQVKRPYITATRHSRRPHARAALAPSFLSVSLARLTRRVLCPLPVSPGDQRVVGAQCAQGLGDTLQGGRRLRLV
eukprot:scaffold99905_cov32-Tisochrysis_lutea.AAC.1